MDVHPTIDRLFEYVTDNGFIPETGMARLDKNGDLRIFMSVELPECIVIGLASDDRLVAYLNTEAAAFIPIELHHIDDFINNIKVGKELLERVSNEILNSEEFQSEPLPNNVIFLQPNKIVSE